MLWGSMGNVTMIISDHLLRRVSAINARDTVQAVQSSLKTTTREFWLWLRHIHMVNFRI